MDNILGNCRGHKVEDSNIDLAMKPLRKRKDQLKSTQLLLYVHTYYNDEYF